MKGLPADVVPIAAKGDRPVEVGAEALRSGGAIAPLHLLAREMKAIAAADAEDHESRLDGGHELRRRRGSRAVVQRLYDGGTSWLEQLLAVCLDVAGQKHAHFAVPH